MKELLSIIKAIVDAVLLIIKSIVDTALLLLRLIVERFITPWLILIYGILFLLFKNWINLSVTVNKFHTPEFILIKDYLYVVLSLPVAIFIISMVFFYKFSDAIKTFLQNSRLTGIGGATVDRAQSQPGEVNIDTDAAQRAEVYEFSYLDLFLVPNTKHALFWFYTQPNNSSIKENFINTYEFVAGIPPNPLAEKEAILNALLTNQLLTENRGIFSVTNKGERFLRALRMIQ